MSGIGTIRRILQACDSDLLSVIFNHIAGNQLPAPAQVGFSVNFDFPGLNHFLSQGSVVHQARQFQGLA